MRSIRIKGIQSVLIILIILMQLLIPTVTRADDTVSIKFNDENMYNAMVEVLGDKISSTDDSTYTIEMTQDNIDSVTGISLEKKEITDISGIGNFTNLSYLNFADNNIVDITEIGNLENLTNLYLQINQISDISALKNLTQLAYLSLGNNDLDTSDFEILSEMYENGNLDKLTGLWLWGLEIESLDDIDFVAELNLKCLDIRENNISDISLLSNLTNLTELYAGDNEISDISALSGLTNLTNLWLYSNNISDISALSGLTNLTELHLDTNNISDISALSKLTNLTNLYISDNEINDISALSGLTNLTDFWLNGNEISDISVLDELLDSASFWISDQTLTITSEGLEVELPAIFQQAFSMCYATELSTYNCTVNDDYTIATVDEGATEATVTIVGGYLRDSVLTISIIDESDDDTSDNEDKSSSSEESDDATDSEDESSSSAKSDETTSSTSLPNTGDIKYFLAIILTILLSVVVYKKMKKIKTK